MDPKSIANLDPKLRETYERVMGNTTPTATVIPSAGVNTPTAPAGTPTTPDMSLSSSLPTPPVADTVSPTPPPTDLSAPVTPEPQLSQTLSNQPSPSLNAAPSASFNTSTFGIPSTPPATNQPAEMQPLMSPAAAAQSTTAGTSSLIKVLYIFGGIIFFIVYVFFWIKIFNYQLPF